MRNDGTVDGSNAISPRVSFNLAVDEDRKFQFRGGAGHFVGRIPWVLVSNSWGSPGIGRTGGITTLNTAATPVQPLLTYLQKDFDPKNPIGQVASATITGAAVNLIKDKLAAPSVWRGNLALDAKVPFLDSVLTLENVTTIVDQGLFIRHLNIKPTTVAADGRQLFAGSVNTAANRIHPEFSDVLKVDNVSKGGSNYLSLSLNRPMKNHWSSNFAYTIGSSKDPLMLGETVAFSLWQRNPIFNQNTPTLARSPFEIRNRVKYTLAREFEFVKKAKTTISLYYEGRTGNPYSYTYSGDANGDGQNGNDLVYVPTGLNDPVLANLPPAVAQAYMNFVNNSELKKYAGSVAPRNAFTAPWINRLDLHVAQTIPLQFRTLELEVFADFINFGVWLSKRTFGYTETITGGGDNELLSVSNFGNATYNAAGQLQMTGTAFVNPAIATPNNELSRWRMQFGVRLKF
jgi:hypothetical protein